MATPRKAPRKAPKPTKPVITPTPPVYRPNQVTQIVLDDYEYQLMDRADKAVRDALVVLDGRAEALDDLLSYVSNDLMDELYDEIMSDINLHLQIAELLAEDISALVRNQLEEIDHDYIANYFLDVAIKEIFDNFHSK